MDKISAEQMRDIAEKITPAIQWNGINLYTALQMRNYHRARVAAEREQHAAMVAKLRELSDGWGNEEDGLTCADQLNAKLGAEPATPVKVDAEDVERLEWLMHHTSGKALREIGVNADGANWRDAIDEAIRSDGGWEVDCG